MTFEARDLLTISVSVVKPCYVLSPSLAFLRLSITTSSLAISGLLLVMGEGDPFLSHQNTPSYGLEMVPRIILVICAKNSVNLGPPDGGGPMPWNNWHNG